MVVKKDNGKVKMKLTEDELIIKGIFKDKRIKRKDIRSACITDSSFIVLTYGYKITYVPITNVKWSYKEQLKLLVDEINKEDIIFRNSNIQDNNFTLFIWALTPIWTNFSGNNIALGIILVIVYGILLVYNIWRSRRFKGVIYNIDTKTFTRVGYKNFNIENFEIEDIELIKGKKANLTYRVKKSRYKFYLKNEGDKIQYPVRHGQALKEIENHFIKAEIIN